MPEKPKKKIRRRKGLESIDNRPKNKGRPSLKEITELNPEMEDLMMLMARGMPAEKAGKYLQLSKHKISSWPKLEIFQQQLERWRRVWSKEETEKWNSINDEIIIEAVSALRRKMRLNKVSESMLKKIIDEKLITIGIKKIEREEGLTFTETRKTELKGKPTARERPAIAFDTSSTVTDKDGEIDDAEVLEDD